LAAAGLKPVNGLNPNGVPANPGVPDSVCGPSAFHQLKPNGVCGVGNWAPNGEPNWFPNWLPNGVPNWLLNWLPNWEAKGELNQFHGVGAHWLVGWLLHGLKPWKPFQLGLLPSHGVFHELFDQLLVADHGEEFQSLQLFPAWKPANGENWLPKDWFHDGLNPWKPWKPLNPNGVAWKFEPNGVLNMIFPLVGCWCMTTALAIG